MKHLLAGALLASAIGLALGACDSSDNGGGGFSSGGGGGGTTCSSYTSCGTCTPVSGCGWCFNASGGGCASDPDQCASANEFTWTWNASGCPDFDAQVVAPADAGGGGSEASAAKEAGEASRPEGGGVEAATEAAVEAAASDASSE